MTFGCTRWKAGGASAVALFAIVTLTSTDFVAAGDDESPQAVEVQPTPAVAAASGGIGAWVAEHTTSLPPVQPALSFDFPLEFGRHLMWDTAYILTAPARWDRCDWVEFSLLAAATGGTFGLDDPIDHWSRVTDPRSNTEADIEDAIQNFGSLAGIAGVLGGGYLYGLLAGDERMQRDPFTLGESLIIANLVFVVPVKAITGRERPNAGQGPWDWFAGGKSFPSSHSTTAFTLATGVSEYADNNLWVAVPAYALATAVGFSRIRANAHFLSDVFVGGTVGVVTTKTVFSLEWERSAHDDTGLRVALAPFASDDVRGIQLIARF